MHYESSLHRDDCGVRTGGGVEATLLGSRFLTSTPAVGLLWDSYIEQGVPLSVYLEWKIMGWQGSDPSTDFRGGGFISLENLLFFARKFPRTFQQLLSKEGGRRSTWEYPFAVAGVNITFMLIQMLDLRADKPRSWLGCSFLKKRREHLICFIVLLSKSWTHCGLQCMLRTWSSML
ncbi:hypothetical protein GOP47_0018679 [Adiantum capillus-veneris]|uniref:ELMO domain-containing protein n=1 Tax=Adiantum capillus-veneris TaxID=13818 RepID=A0A9D4Z9V0_ADICA|nr:hypothetical protein GOP47_0018679 [Adiantum capillus-veneris]